MSRKRKQRKRPSGTQRFDRAKRELAKGNAKTALKDAETCYRQAPTTDHRGLLEQAYVGRVQQLQRMKLSAEARAVLAKLIELGPTSPEIKEQIPRLQVVVGDAGADAAAIFGQDPALLVEQTDQAVLDPRVAAPDCNGIKQQVGQVRHALAAVERGEDEAAADLLKDVPRSSPLCDWKLFVRGLSAFYQSDGPRMKENWRRLDTARPAFRIAQTLLVASGESSPEQSPIDVSASLRRLRVFVQTDRAADLVKEVAAHWREGNWRALMRSFRHLRQRYARRHPRLIAQIVDLAWKRAAREGERWLLDDLIRIGPAPAMDPRWNRARALASEHPRHTDAATTERFWLHYVEDLAAVPGLREEERETAAGLVHLRLARRFVDYAKACDRSTLFYPADPEQAEAFRLRAADLFREGIERCPRLIAYRELAELHEVMEEPDESAAVLKGLLRQQPDDFDAHLWLANYYLGQDEPGQSEKHVETVFRLKPRDPVSASLRWNQRVTMIRCLTKKRQFGAALHEWEELAQLPRTNAEDYTLDTLRAGIELKGKNREVAQRYLDAAVNKAGEPTAVWMQMSCTAARFSLPREMKKDFDNRFKEAIKGKPTSATAGRLTRFLAMLKGYQVNYTGRATQERLVLEYLKRADRIAWNEEDIRSVCQFLRLLPKEWELRKGMISTAAKQYPDNAYFHFCAGECEMEVGPFACDIETAMFHMNRVVELGQASNDPRDRPWIEQAHRALTMLDDVKQATLLPLGYHDEEDEDDDDWEDDDDDYGPYDDGEYDDDDEYDEYGYDDDDEGPPSFGALDAEGMFADMERLLPRPMIERLKRMAAEAGVDPVKQLRKFFRDGFGK